MKCSDAEKDLGQWNKSVQCNAVVKRVNLILKYISRGMSSMSGKVVLLLNTVLNETITGILYSALVFTIQKGCGKLQRSQKRARKGYARKDYSNWSSFRCVMPTCTALQVCAYTPCNQDQTVSLGASL